MAEIHELSVAVRDRAGKGAARATRRAGRVPGVVYGGKQEPLLISLDPRDVNREIRKDGFYVTLFDLKTEKVTERVLPRDVQFDPLSDKPTHVDFMRVSENTRVTVEVPVHFLNDTQAPGIKRGGVLNVVRHAIEVTCLPTKIPAYVEVDLTGMEIGDSVHIDAVTLPEGVKPTILRNFTIASIAAPSAIRAEAIEARDKAAAEAAAAEAAAAAAAAAPAAGAAPGAPGAAAPAGGAPAAGAAPAKDQKK